MKFSQTHMKANCHSLWMNLNRVKLSCLFKTQLVRLDTQLPSYVTPCLRKKIRSYRGLFNWYCLSWSIQSEKLSCKCWYHPHLIQFWNIMVTSLILFLLSFQNCHRILQKGELKFSIFCLLKHIIPKWKIMLLIIAHLFPLSFLNCHRIFQKGEFKISIFCLLKHIIPKWKIMVIIDYLFPMWILRQ